MVIMTMLRLSGGRLLTMAFTMLLSVTEVPQHGMLLMQSAEA